MLVPVENFKEDIGSWSISIVTSLLNCSKAHLQKIVPDLQHYLCFYKCLISCLVSPFVILMIVPPE
jgi:hypothetical protein